MQINLETNEAHAIQAYSDTQVKINSIIYEHSLIVSRQEIITDIAINNIQEITDHSIELLLECKPEVIIVGHGAAGQLPPFAIISQLAQKNIGIEFMSIGAACRTYNVLLSEFRDVVALIIMPTTISTSSF